MERRLGKGLETTGLDKSSGHDQGLGAWSTTTPEEEAGQAAGPWSLLLTKANTTLNGIINRGAARCPEGGGWGDGDHDPGESVTGV